MRARAVPERILGSGEQTRLVSRWEAIDRVERGGLCCASGRRVDCVCRLSVHCPTHGAICVGSHD